MQVDSGSMDSIRITVLSRRSSQAAEADYQVASLEHKLTHVEPGQPHIITHRHPSSGVAYSILRPPPADMKCLPPYNSAPILFLLHGAGVDVAESMTRDAVAALPSIDAWILVPSGMSTWSGDDWRKSSLQI